ncbi:MAG: monomeric [Kiritimatiellae bacterium]|nr:monomeric [FeFe] hydrogenase [Kiritimatiellia bacterium]
MSIPMISEADRLRREVLAYVIKAVKEGKHEEIDRIPLKMRPKGAPSSRCCIYKDRAALRYRCMSALGFRVEDETDELKTLASYADDTKTTSPACDPFLTIFPDACSACMESQIMVTNMCRGCLARPCTNICPRKAIQVRNGRARISHELCINCGKCAEVCRYHAIIQVPLACADACPVGAIGKTDDGRVTVDDEKCIRCGRCIKACPFAAIMQSNQVAHVVRDIKEGKKVIALVAPAINGFFPVEPGKLYAALKQIGFSEVHEVALGGDDTAIAEAAEWAERKAEGAPFMTTSCCPAWMECVERHIPEIKPYVSHTPSPMIFSDRRAKAMYPDAVTVFIGPCMAKRTEAHKKGSPDYVITAEEVGAWLMAENVQLDDLEAVQPELGGTHYGAEFAISGGVANAVAHYLPEGAPKPTVFKINGLNKKNIALLKVFAKTKKAPADIIEIMVCPGGCVAGPCAIATPEDATKAIQSRRPEDFEA